MIAACGKAAFRWTVPAPVPAPRSRIGPAAGSSARQQARQRRAELVPHRRWRGGRRTRPSPHRTGSSETAIRPTGDIDPSYRSPHTLSCSLRPPAVSYMSSLSVHVGSNVTRSRMIARSRTCSAWRGSLDRPPPGELRVRARGVDAPRHRGASEAVLQQTPAATTTAMERDPHDPWPASRHTPSRTTASSVGALSPAAATMRPARSPPTDPASTSPPNGTDAVGSNACQPVSREPHLDPRVGVAGADLAHARRSGRARRRRSRWPTGPARPGCAA